MTGTGLCHEALLYDSDTAYCDAVLPFLRDGLADGDALVAAVRTDHTALLRDALGADAAQVMFIDREEWYRRPAVTIAGWRGLLAQAQARGHGRARIVGEVVFGGVDRHRSWTRYESAVNALFADAPAWIVCPYDTRVLPDQVVADAHRTHPVVRDPDRRDSTGYRPPAALLPELPEDPPPVTGPPAADLVLRDVSELGAIRRTVRAVASGWPDDPLDDLLLVATEIAINGLRHGSGQRHLRLWRADDTIVCEVSDDGPGPPDPLVGYGPPPDDSLGGRGLWLVRQLCDAMAISTTAGRTHVRVAMTAT
ncbi:MULTISPECIES: anti-sigma factor RsbA family regulatory protein [Catenuloplanes]|uniref:Anti-sigma regulatory factor (Ser/Thr protein kinase)/predicted DCC family thiol-disulfide oxidoreductase YuxK n=1 Tax=Catenuloplanes niger TaxID=587534 RepID=A0AAE3ZW81_9ACTN|nr:anti-sigma factor RsbA family regulatory protein [Catenuloplanes niger]MDR7326941.1 anti-sigma regulatory factor (Ser/Thr protein kinase)/predicted DCC family thiol-disulfide oxidoreductase YuxK [Catenuloplanes niger]